MTSDEQDYEAVLSAVESGDNSAKTKLAWYKLSGLGGCKIDTNGAVALLEERVKDRDSDAMWMLGGCSEFGIGAELNRKRSESLYKQSSEEGNETGEFLLDRNSNERGGIIRMNG